MPTPASMPASRRTRKARRRWCGGGVFGSVLRQISGWSVGTENVTDTFAHRAASARTSTSRTIIGPRVMIANGLCASASTCRQPRVSR